MIFFEHLITYFHLSLSLSLSLSQYQWNSYIVHIYGFMPATKDKQEWSLLVFLKIDLDKEKSTDSKLW